MNAAEIKQKLLMQQMNGEEFDAPLNKNHRRKGGGFLKTPVNAFRNGYAGPQMLKPVLEFTLLFLIIAGTVVLSYSNKLEVTITASLLSIITGYILGRSR